MDEKINFGHKEKLKRIDIAKQLLDKGFSIKKIAEYFDVSESTVKSYLQEEHKASEQTSLIAKEEIKGKVTLDNFSDSTVGVKEFFPAHEKTGMYCPLCKQYYKLEMMMDFSSGKKICKICYKGLDLNKIDLI